MKIDGRAIASTIYTDLIEKVGELKLKNITPTLSVILVGNDPGSENYVRQKQIHAEKIGVRLILERFEKVTLEELKPVIEKLNNDPLIDGIIIQRPLNTVSDQDLDSLVIPEKDVDGFHPDSKYDPPVARAVMRLLEDVYSSSEARLDSARQARSSHIHSNNNFETWLKNKIITVVGKGRTAGGPTIKHLRKKFSIDPNIIDSKTLDPISILKKSDIVISAVGKKDAVRAEMLSDKTILIGVGLHMEEDKLRGDFDESSIENIVPYYSGTPGGVGPVNVAMLLANVVNAAENR